MKNWLWLWLLLLLPVLGYGADVNGYTAIYEKAINVPTPTGTPTCAGGSGTNPYAGNEYVIRDNAGWGQINNAAYTKFFVCPNNYISKGVITLTRSGSAATPRYIVWWTDNNYSATLHPIKMADANRAKVRKFVMDGSDYIYIDRLTFVPQYGDGNGVIFNQNSGAEFNIFHRILLEGATVAGTNGAHAFMILAGNHNNTLQNSVFRNGTPVSGEDTVAIQINEWSSFNRVVNNEVYDWTQSVQIGGTTNGNGIGHVIENNDFYVTPARYITNPDRNYWVGKYPNGSYIPLNDPAFSPNGTYMCAESAISLKFGSASAASPTRIFRNRIWGYRPDNDSDCGGTGTRIGAAANILNFTRYVLFERNIFYDNQYGPTMTTRTRAIPPGYIDFRRNLIARVRKYAALYGAYGFNDMSGQNNSWNFNTVADVGAGGVWMSTSDYPQEVACSLVINGGGANKGGNTVANYNVYVGASTNLGEANRRTYTLDQAKLGSYSFYRKLITGPELITIPNVRPNADSPFVDYCDAYNMAPGYGYN